MAINTDGPKRQGRFLKKNSKILSTVSMVDFNFEEICTHPLVGFDNADRSIIHSKFHDPKLLNNVIKQHQTMNDRIQDANTPQLGVIFPADFTQDWHNERLNSKRRALGFDDEDEIDFAEVARNRVSMSAARNADAASRAALQASITSSNQGEPDNKTKTPQSPEPLFSAIPSSPEAVKAPETDGKVKSLNEGDLVKAINKTFVPQPEPNASETSAEDSFTPLPTDSSTHPAAAEDRAIETWKTKQMVAKQHEQILSDLKSEARSEGFQAGFREGEEKGLLSGQKNASNVFSKVSEIITEFDGLKELILENVQKNFYELSQAIGEALLGREFSIKPEAYATMIQRVLKDTVTPNEFKVKMNPETWQKVHDLNIPELESHLVKDQSIVPGDFRIESALTVVDVNAKKLVSQLLEKADIDLFASKSAS